MCMHVLTINKHKIYPFKTGAVCVQEYVYSNLYMCGLPYLHNHNVLIYSLVNKPYYLCVHTHGNYSWLARLA